MSEICGNWRIMTFYLRGDLRIKKPDYMQEFAEFRTFGPDLTDLV
jgi:hypothetical protein